jgi:rRNA-processing protein FCF1
LSIRRRILIPLKIILDTNFLLIPAQFGIDIFSEIDRLVSLKFELIIFQDILNELHELSKQSIKKQKEVNITLELANRCKLIELNSSSSTAQSVDDKIFYQAVKNRWIVATNDRKLRKKLRAHKVPVIMLRKKTHLVIEGDI